MAIFLSNTKVLKKLKYLYEVDFFLNSTRSVFNLYIICLFLLYNLHNPESTYYTKLLLCIVFYVYYIYPIKIRRAGFSIGKT